MLFAENTHSNHLFFFWDRRASMDGNGLAFSGGGIRSAAFCSGVLRRLLQRNTKIDYLSCVSGGGYTGTATWIGNIGMARRTIQNGIRNSSTT